MIMFRSTRWMSTCLCASVVLFLCAGADADAQPTAHFELRLAPGQDDAVLVLGNSADDTLQLEVWVEVTDAASPVWAFSMFLKISQDNVVTFDENFDGIPFVSYACPYNGVNNTPFLGDFSPACFEPGGVMAGIGAPALYGTFSVSAVALGSASYVFDGSDTQVRQWRVSLANGTDIEGDDLSFSIDPAVATIDVVSIVPSADADKDGDVDLQDYGILQSCAATSIIAFNGMSTGPACAALDLNTDGVVDDLDVPLFVAELTGMLPPPGDLDADGDIDLADYGYFQICLTKSGMPALADYCAYADVDRDNDVDLDDFTKLEENLAGPTQ